MKQFILSVLTLMVCVGAMCQGTETFTNMPEPASNYSIRMWTGDNGIAWTATDARTDQNIDGSRAILIRNGALTSGSISNGIATLSFKHQQEFTGSGAVLEVRVNGNLVGTVNPTTTVQTANIENINIAGTFTIEIRQTTAGLRIKIDDLTWTALNTTPCTTPTAQPSALTFGLVTNTGINASFTAASPAANGYLVLISTSNTLSANPQNQVVYNEGEVIGNATVIASSTNTTFTASSLSPGTNYYFYVFSYNSACSGGPLYNTAAPLTANTSTTTPPACEAPTTSPGSLALSPANTSVNGSFGSATGADGYVVVRSTNSAFSFTPANGTTYIVGQTVGVGNDGIVVKYGEGTTFSSTGLTPNTAYYFFVYAVSKFSCTGGPLYNTTATSAGTTTTNSGTGAPGEYYSNATNKNCADLKTALYTITSTGHTPKTYTDLWSQYQVSDVKPREVGPGTSPMVIWDVYSDNPNGVDPYNFTPGPISEGGQQDNGTGGAVEGERYNREHSVPLSWFSGNTGTPGAATDYHHLFPTDKLVNNRRSNYIYGEVAAATFTSLNGSKLGSSAIAGFTGEVFEPIDAYKGDLARAFLYFVTRYQESMPMWTGGTNGTQAFDPNTYPSVDIPYLQLMIKWHNQDPVSQKELDRNNAAYHFQGNRNPYVDHPEYVSLVWNSSCSGLSALPVNILFFSGKLVGDKIMLQWKVENEINFDRYEVERSFNGTSYVKVGEVKAINQRSYSFDDDADAVRGKRVYYRLKKIDRDGQYKFSEVFSVHVPLNTKFNVYPNPANSYIQLQLNRNVNGNVTVQLTDASGKVLKQQNLNVSGSNVRLNTQDLQGGTYLVKLIINGEQFIRKLVVVK